MKMILILLCALFVMKNVLLVQEVDQMNVRLVMREIGLMRRTLVAIVVMMLAPNVMVQKIRIAKIALMGISLIILEI